MSSASHALRASGVPGRVLHEAHFACFWRCDADLVESGSNERMISVADEEGVSAGMPSQERRSQLKLRRSPERNPTGERLRREQRLRSPRDFQRVRAQGKRVSGGLLSLGYAAQDEPGWTRIGFSVSRRVGGAVIRNRVKRRLREVLRRKLADIAPGFDLVITARAGAADARIETLDQETRALLTRARLLRAATHRGTGQ